MRCVKLTLPAPVRASWLFRIWRLTSSSFAGIARTDVAVGTPRLASMFSTLRAAAPRRGSGSSPSRTSGPGRGCGDGGRGALTVGTVGTAREVRAPALVHRRGVLEVALVQLFHQAGVRP